MSIIKFFLAKAHRHDLLDYGIMANLKNTLMYRKFFLEKKTRQNHLPTYCEKEL